MVERAAVAASPSYRLQHPGDPDCWAREDDSPCWGEVRPEMGEKPSIIYACRGHAAVLHAGEYRRESAVVPA